MNDKPNKPEPEIKECGYCAKTFEPGFDGQPDFCSPACYEVWNEMRQQIEEQNER